MIVFVSPSAGNADHSGWHLSRLPRRGREDSLVNLRSLDKCQVNGMSADFFRRSEAFRCAEGVSDPPP